jgi:hypothetical protein
MAGTLNLYLDPMLSYSWCECSLLAAKLLDMGFIMQGIFGHGFNDTLPPKNSPFTVMEGFTHLSLRIKTLLKTSSCI